MFCCWSSCEWAGVRVLAKKSRRCSFTEHLNDSEVKTKPQPDSVCSRTLCEIPSCTLVHTLVHSRHYFSVSPAETELRLLFGGFIYFLLPFEGRRSKCVRLATPFTKLKLFYKSLQCVVHKR